MKSKSISNGFNQSTTTKTFINVETIRIFIKFLTMNPSFYGYTMLNVNPADNLYGDQFVIKTRLGTGFNSIAYLLFNRDYERSNRNRKSRVMKISNSNRHNEIFLNEVNILKQLKQIMNPHNFYSFFSNILYWSPEGNLFSLKKLTTFRFIFT